MRGGQLPRRSLNASDFVERFDSFADVPSMSTAAKSEEALHVPLPAGFAPIPDCPFVRHLVLSVSTKRGLEPLAVPSFGDAVVPSD